MFDPIKPSKDINNSKQHILFLSLMLLLLAFFILLQSLSTLEEQRLEAVIDSIEESFNFDKDLIVVDRAVTSQLDESFAYPDKVRELGDLFETEFKLAKVTRFKSGEKMVIDIDAIDIFDPDTGKFFPYNTGLLDRVADVLLKDHRAGHYKLDFYVFKPKRKYTDEIRKRNISQAGDVAVYLKNLNVPSSRIGVGIENGDPSKIRFLFHRQTPLLDGENVMQENAK